MYARGTIVGLTRGSGRRHIVRAALESIAYQSNDLLNAMTQDSGGMPPALRVDGGATANRFLMQFQADLMRLPVQRPAVLETTALGAALLSGLAVGLYGSLDETAQGWHVAHTFTPALPEEQRQKLLGGWKQAVERTLTK